MNINDKLIEACESGDLLVVKKCVKKGADIHAWEDAALRYAAINKHLKIVKYLVKQGADVRADDDDALLSAADDGHLEMVKYLIEQGADIHTTSDWALRYAARNGHLQVVNVLRKAAGSKYKCHQCIIKSTCLDLCNDFRQYQIFLGRRKSLGD
jgi:ankyrin repeat protein